MTFFDLLAALEVDSDDLLRRFGNNQAILEHFLLKFPSDPTMSLLSTSSENQDIEKFELYAHTLKGVSNNLGLGKLALLSSDSVQHIRKAEILDAFQMFSAIKNEYTRITDILLNYQKEKES